MSAPKKPFALRLGSDIMEALEKWASDEFRSTNGQIEYLLHDALKRAGRLPGKSQDNKDRSSSKSS
ncbi:MAG: Arc family DNA-binding protein [Chitinophagales bacterium]|nr:Arc family DNA-binding protein [Chitinophagales bacterium]HAE13960.1 Arc family DNA binding domain-containing protein [Bacteroidota bacterium]MCB9019637.1 Arc family DNA-binding protein [Chitinophagales bacterium]MCB9021139.1 Arc family DNA-binding protein [Chitinophagales bacterium]HPE96514.1 Arc family DNA-binding protein [Chitinophagales bacterium]